MITQKRQFPRRKNSRNFFSKTSDPGFHDQEIARSKREECYRALLEKLNVWIWEINSSGFILYVNSMVKESLGYLPEEMVGKPFWNFISVEEANLQDEVTPFRAYSDGSSEIREVRLTKKGGPPGEVIKGFPFFFEDGVLAGFYGVDRVITQGKVNDEREWQRREELEGLASITSALRQARNSRELASTIVEKATNLLNADACGILLLQEETLNLVAGFGALKIDESPQGSVNLGGLSWLINSGNSLFISNRHSGVPASYGKVIDLLPIQLLAFSIAPIRTVDGTQGALIIGWQKPHQYSESEKRLLAALADMGGNAIQRTTVMETLEKRITDRTRELRALYQITSIATKVIELPTLLDQALTIILSFFKVTSGMIHLLDENPGQLLLVNQQGIPVEVAQKLAKVSLEGNILGKIVAEGQPLFLENFSEEPEIYALVDESEAAKYAGAPLRGGGKTLGVLSIIGQKIQPIRESDRPLLTALADQIGVLVENSRLRHQADMAILAEERQRLARELHDSVTQLLYSLVLFAGAGREAAKVGDLSGAAHQLSRMDETAQQALKEMRLLIYELRPSALSEVGLVGALRQRLDAVERRANVVVELESDIETEMPMDIQEGFYRIAQEALNNSLKHSQSSWVTVSLTSNLGHYGMTIADNGIGFVLSEALTCGGLGLTTMHERVDTLGGKMEIITRPGEGARIIITVERWDGR